jgi:thiol-disulfide isomerase/thioredoxin
MPKGIDKDRRWFLRRAAMTLAAVQSVRVGSAAMRLPIEGESPALRNATTWLNSQPMSNADLRGKVVLVDFWTYSCINWRRTLPYVRAWANKYKAHGLEVVGVHTPEFPFEREVDNVRDAAMGMTINYAIAIDNGYAIWNAFQNEYWPALYFVDGKGRIRHHKFGEGDYDKSEGVIQQLLVEEGADSFDPRLVSVDAAGAEAAADWGDLRSQENYLGNERTVGFASHERAVLEKPHTYAVPARLELNHWALAGDWTVKKQAIVLNAAGGGIAYEFHARDLHLVMGPAARGTRARFRVLVDGEIPGGAHGVDADEQGNGTVTEPRMYQLIRQSRPIVDRKFEIRFLDPGVEAYSFTFG